MAKYAGYPVGITCRRSASPASCEFTSDQIADLAPIQQIGVRHDGAIERVVRTAAFEILQKLPAVELRVAAVKRCEHWCTERGAFAKASRDGANDPLAAVWAFATDRACYTSIRPTLCCGVEKPSCWVYNFESMPTVLQSDGFQVRILLPPREHGPPHVHVSRAGAEVVILLPGEGQALEIKTVYRMRAADVIAAVRLIEANLPLLTQAWRTYHG